MKKFIIILTLCLPVLLIGQVGITYTLANGQITTDANGTYFEFDVMAQATATGTGIGTGIVFLSYNAPAFGSMIRTSGNLTATEGTLLNNPYLYGITPNDTYANVFALTHIYGAMNPGLGIAVPTSATQLEHVKMKILDTTASIQVCFWPGNGNPPFDTVMADEQFNDQFINYEPVVANMCIYNDPPLPVELSYFNCVMNNSYSAVNLTWVTQTETNMVGYRIYRGFSDDLAVASDLNTMIAATNTSQTSVYVYSDKEIEPSQSYYYWLEAQEMDGTADFYGPISILTPGEMDYHPSIPLVTGISSLYPNPFNPDLNISYQLESKQYVQISVINPRGQLVKILVDEIKEIGSHKYIWDGKDKSGRACASGIYQIRMKAGNDEYFSKAVLIK